MKRSIVIIFVLMSLAVSAAQTGIMPFTNDESNDIILNFMKTFSSLTGREPAGPLFITSKAKLIYKKAPLELTNNEALSLAKRSGLKTLIWGEVTGEDEVKLLELRILDVETRRISKATVDIWDDLPDVIQMEEAFAGLANEAGNIQRELELDPSFAQQAQEGTSKGMLAALEIGVSSKAYADMLNGGTASSLVDTGVHGFVELRIKNGDKFLLETMFTDDQRRSKEGIMLGRVFYRKSLGEIQLTAGDRFLNMSQLSFSRNLRGFYASTPLFGYNIQLFSGLGDMGYDGFRYPLFSSGFSLSNQFTKLLSASLGMLFSQEVDWQLVKDPQNIDKSGEFSFFTTLNGTWDKLNYRAQIAMSQSRSKGSDPFLPGHAFILESAYFQEDWNTRIFISRYSSRFSARTAANIKDRQELFGVFNWAFSKKITLFVNTRYMHNSLDDSSARIWEVTPALGASLRTASFGSYTLRFQQAIRKGQNASSDAARTNIDLGNSMSIAGISLNSSLNYSGSRTDSGGYDLYSLILSLAKVIKLMGVDLSASLNNSTSYSNNFGSANSTNNATFLNLATTLKAFNIAFYSGYDHANASGNINGLFRYGLRTSLKLEWLGEFIFEFGGENSSDRNVSANNSAISRISLGWENRF